MDTAMTFHALLLMAAPFIFGATIWAFVRDWREMTARHRRQWESMLARHRREDAEMEERWRREDAVLRWKHFESRVAMDCARIEWEDCQREHHDR
jgi:hypothetical protein